MEPEKRADLLLRLRCVEGHTRGVARMVEDGADCLDLIRQVKALQGALDKITLLVVENHLDDCLPSALESGDPAVRKRALTLFGEVLEMPLAGRSEGPSLLDR